MAVFGKEQRMGVIMVAPYIIHLAIFFGYPLVFALVLVFHRWDIVTEMQFTGLGNVDRLVNDDVFFRAIINTGFFLVIHIPLQIAVALFLASLLNEKLKGRGFFRTVYFLPVVVSGVVVSGVVAAGDVSAEIIGTWVRRMVTKDVVHCVASCGGRFVCATHQSQTRSFDFSDLAPCDLKLAIKPNLPIADQ